MSIIAIVADVQVGHQAALWPDGYKNHNLTPAQKVVFLPLPQNLYAFCVKISFPSVRPPSMPNRYVPTGKTF